MSTFTDLEKDAASVDGFVNENGLIPTRRNGPKPSWQYLVDEIRKSRGFRVVGTFSDGFTYEIFNDVGIDADGNSWIYVGAGAPNKVVTAGTVPSVGAGYEKVTFNQIPASNVTDLNGGTVQDFINLSMSESATRTTGEMDWHVNPTTGVDDEGYGISAGAPFKTIQYAFDQLPEIIVHEQRINLSSGVFNKSSRAAADMPRPAIFYPQGKYISKRTTQSGSGLDGMVIIKGSGVDVSYIESDPASGYVNGVYVSGTEIGMHDLTVKPASSGTTSTLVVSHRGAYVHGRNLKIGGAEAGLGVVCEAGGWAEIISSTVKGCAGRDVVVYATSACSLAGAASDIGNITNTGFLQIAQSCEVNGELKSASGGVTQTTSSSASFPVTLNGQVVLSDCTFTTVYANINNNVIAEASSVGLNASGFQKTITCKGGTLRLSAAKSYVAPKTQSSSASPIALRNGAELVRDAATVIRDSAGILVSADYGNQRVTVSSDEFELYLTDLEKITSIQVIGSGANRSGLKLMGLSGVIAGTAPSDGQILHLAGIGYNVEIVSSATVSIPGGSITIGELSGAYTGATFIYSFASKKWYLQGVGALIS